MEELVKQMADALHVVISSASEIAKLNEDMLNKAAALKEKSDRADELDKLIMSRKAELADLNQRHDEVSRALKVLKDRL